MFSVSSGSYNGYPTQLYGGVTTGGRTSGGGVSLPWESKYDYDNIWGGLLGRRKKKRKVTKKQLAALAKGRQILKAHRKKKRRYVGAAIKRLIGGKAGKGDLSSLDDFYEPTSMHMTEDSVDKAALEFQRILSKLRDEYLIFEEADIVPSAFPLVRRLSNLLNFLIRAGRKGFENSYGISPESLTNEQKATLARYQSANLRSAPSSMSVSSAAARRLFRNYLKRTNIHGTTPSAADITRAIKTARAGTYEDDEEEYVPKKNPWRQ